MDEKAIEAFVNEMGKIATTAYLFRDPTPYSERAKVREAVRSGIAAQGKATSLGTGIGTGGGALLGGAGGALAGYAGGSGRALPAILGGLAGAAGGGTAGFFGGREIGKRIGEKKLKGKGVYPVKVKDSPQLRSMLRPALQRKGLDVVMSGGKNYSKEDLAKLRSSILSRVGAPDPAVLQSLGLPTLK